jgi:hypothetical protein
MKLTDIYNSIKEEMSDEDDTTKIFSRLRKQLDPNYTDKIDKPVVKPNNVYVDLDKEIIDGTTGKPIISYVLPKNGDGSYKVVYNDGEQGLIYVSNDVWDEINDLARQNMNEEFKRMQKLAGVINENDSRYELHRILKGILIASRSTSHDAEAREIKLEKELENFMKQNPEFTEEMVEKIQDDIAKSL